MLMLAIAAQQDVSAALSPGQALYVILYAGAIIFFCSASAARS